jgi:hypothetical protein
LSLPDSAPADPFAATGDFSVFGCDGEFLAISLPTRDELKRIQRRLRRILDLSGHYPKAIQPISVRGVAYWNESAELTPSVRAPIVRIMYHRVGDAYGLELRISRFRVRVPPADRSLRLRTGDGIFELHGGSYGRDHGHPECRRVGVILLRGPTASSLYSTAGNLHIQAVTHAREAASRSALSGSHLACTCSQSGSRDRGAPLHGLS